jgi:hypothetical protein
MGMGQAEVVVVQPEHRGSIGANNLGSVRKLADQPNPEWVMGVKDQGPPKAGHSFPSDSVQVDDFSVGHRFRA